MKNRCMSKKNSIDYEKMFSGDMHTIAKCISEVENDMESASVILDKIFHKTGKSIRLGLTGPPGVGKSTLVCEIASYLRLEAKSVGIIAIDPTSPFTGGALLGDRIRMNRLIEDDGVFIRSMATRGFPGGIARATCDVADLLDAVGKQFVIIETVGVGQSELEIAKFADVVIVVLSPESGDSVQAMKSGLMETADFIVINKKDRPGADRLASEIQSAFELRTNKKEVPIIQTQAQNGEGIDNFVELVQKWVDETSKNGEFKKRRKKILYNRIRSICTFMVSSSIWNSNSTVERLEKAVSDLLEYKGSPYKAAEGILKEILRA